jgi:hypothetical protein
MSAVAEHDETDFLAAREFFDPVADPALNGSLGFSAAVRDDHAPLRPSRRPTATG